MSPAEVTPLAHEFISWVGLSLNIYEATIVCPLTEPCDLNPVLDALNKHVLDEARISLYGAFVPSSLLNRLFSEWGQVELIGCALGEDWWLPPTDARRCAALSLTNCTAFPSQTIEYGCASWCELEVLFVNEGVWDASLASPNEYGPTHDSGFPAGTAAIVTAFSHPGLNQLSVNWCPNVSFLTSLPVSNLSDIWLSGSPTDNQVLAWIANHPCLGHVSISWKPGTKLDWGLLGKMRKLRGLDVASSTFSDSDLATVATHTRLRVIWGYYTNLTPASWPLVLSMRWLKQIWVSTEMLHGPMPTGLPPTTKLVEVVSLNVGQPHLEYLKKLLEPYPLVKTCEM